MKSRPSIPKTQAELCERELLEPSPFAVDGGNLIGRDPREIELETWEKNGYIAEPLLKVFRAKCIDCCSGSESEARKCVLTSCPLWPYRLGCNPFRKRSPRRGNGEALAAWRARQHEAAIDQAEIREADSPVS